MALTRDPRIPVLVMSAYGTIGIAVEAMKQGAYDFVTKPFDTNQLEALLTHAVERRPLAADAAARRAAEIDDAGGILGESPAIHAVIREARQVAASDATVLVLGESGTGKELVARAIHRWSGRGEGPLVSVNCAAIPRELMESEFFGSEKGSFTGATARKLGKVELAKGGTLFLDEIAELPGELQAKLLRVLQERTFARVGGTEELHADIRVIAATNKDPAALVREGRFREDLYYRLNVFPIRMPALRDRVEDVVPLAREFAWRASKKMGKSRAREALARRRRSARAGRMAGQRAPAGERDRARHDPRRRRGDSGRTRPRHRRRCARQRRAGAGARGGIAARRGTARAAPRRAGGDPAGARGNAGQQDRSRTASRRFVQDALVQIEGVRAGMIATFRAAFASAAATNARRFMVALAAIAMTPAVTAAASPVAASAGTKAPFVVDHVESPQEIGIGTMAVNVWARFGAARPGGVVGGCTLVLTAAKGEEEVRVEMRAQDGAFDEEIETAVATLDTYTWVVEETHRWEIRAHEPGGREAAVTKGSIRVRERVNAKDLVLFDGLGSATPMLGTGAGGFSPAEVIASGVPQGRPRAVDWSGDGRLDLVYAGADGEVVILENDGGGRFNVLRRIACTATPVDVAPCDLDGDGAWDLAVATEARALEIYLGEDDIPAQVESLPGTAELLEVGDFDGDGRMEIAIALLGMDDSEIQLWGRAPREEIWTPTLRLPAPSGGRGRVQSLVAFRVKERKHDRLIIGSTSEGQAMLESWGVTADTQARPGISCLAVARFAGSLAGVACGRIAKEGNVAVLAAVKSGDGAEILAMGEGDAPRKLASLSRAPRAMALVDLDADGDDDLIAAGDELRLWINVRGESFHEAGESPYLLDTPVVTLLAGELDERRP